MNDVVSNWLIPRVLSLTQNWNTDLINGWMNKANLLRADCSRLSSPFTHLSFSGQHTVSLTHVLLCTPSTLLPWGRVCVCVLDKKRCGFNCGFATARSAPPTVLMSLRSLADCTRLGANRSRVDSKWLGEYSFFIEFNTIFFPSFTNINTLIYLRAFQCVYTLPHTSVHVCGMALTAIVIMIIIIIIPLLV